MATSIPKPVVIDRAKGRIIEQYKKSPNFIAWIEAIARQSQELLDAQHSVLEAFDKNTATGLALDWLGEWVGLPRPLIDITVFDFFGYEGAGGELGYGTLSDPSVGGVYASLGDVTDGFVPMEDEMYRLNIDAKILRNYGSATPDQILEIVSLVFPGSEPSEVTQNGTAGYLLTIGRPLSNIEQALLELEDLNGEGDQLIPRAAGVKATYA